MSLCAPLNCNPLGPEQRVLPILFSRVLTGTQEVFHECLRKGATADPGTLGPTLALGGEGAQQLHGVKDLMEPSLKRPLALPSSSALKKNDRHSGVLTCISWQSF